MKKYILHPLSHPSEEDSTKEYRKCVLRLRACYAFSMRRMGIDYGTKRIGVALTDESGTMAFPHSVVPNDDDALDTIAGVATDAKAVEIVVGASVNLKGEDNRLQKDIVQFSETLTAKTDIAVAMQPEQYTTQEALQIQGRNAMTDASAATIILNSYITTKQSQNNS